MLYTHAGPEIAVASTKAFLAQITACYLVGLHLAQVRGDQVRRRGRARYRELRGDARRRSTQVLEHAWSTVAELAPQLADTRSVLFLGRHVGYPVALEGALKLKELAYIHAEGFAAGELKHGPIALIEPGLPVFVVVPSPAVAHCCTPRSSRTSRRSGPAARVTIVIAEEGDETVRPYADEVIRIPRRARRCFQPLLVDRPAAGLRLRAGHGQGPRRRPAAQPRQVRHGRVARTPDLPAPDLGGLGNVVGVGVDVVDTDRFAAVIARTPGRARGGRGRGSAGLRSGGSASCRGAPSTTGAGPAYCEPWPASRGSSDRGSGGLCGGPLIDL